MRQQGGKHILLAFTKTLWAHLWVDHCDTSGDFVQGVGVVLKYAAFQREERHNFLTSGMRCSSAWCGTPPILGVVNMARTRSFTCYMGAL